MEGICARIILSSVSNWWLRNLQNQKCDFISLCVSQGKKKVSADKMVEMQAKIEEERKALEAKLDMEEEERNKARAELEKREKDLLKAQ